jgi:RNA binding exosome subunit
MPNIAWISIDSFVKQTENRFAVLAVIKKILPETRLDEGKQCNIRKRG